MELDTDESKVFQDNDARDPQNDKVADNLDLNIEIEPKDEFKDYRPKRNCLRQRKPISVNAENDQTLLKTNEGTTKRKLLHAKKKEDKELLPITCTVCYKEFITEGGLLNHMRTHKGAVKFNCQLCSTQFDTNKQLLEHKETHANDGHTFSCTPCQLAFSTHYDYVVHSLMHKKGQSHRCPECTYVSRSKALYRAHIEFHFNNRFTCEICEKSIKGEPSFKAHVKEHENEYKCPECGKVLHNKYGLEYHMTSHTGVKKFQCLYCGKGHGTTQQRNIHMMIHTGEKPFECDICQERFRRRGDLQSHETTHSTEKRYECKYCHKMFRNKAYMKTHERIHTRTNMYPCAQCGLKFIGFANLRSHTISKHTTERVVECPVCCLKFKTRNYLVKHFKSKKHQNAMFGHMKKKEENELVHIE